MSLKLLGLMRRANALSPGQDRALSSVKEGKAKLLLLPSDASDRARRNAENAVKGRNTGLLEVPYTGSEIAGAIGLDACAMLAINDSGFADSFLKSLAKETEKGM